jgi:RHS repeat-associated protein
MVCELAVNQLSGSLPDSLGRLQQLQQFYLNNNKLSGTIPASVLRLPALYQYDYSNNGFTDIQDLGNATGSLFVGDLGFNHLPYAALERLYTAAGQPRYTSFFFFSSYSAVGVSGQTPGPGVETVGYQLRKPLTLRAPQGMVTAHTYGYQWQRLVSNQWVDMPGDTLSSKTWAQGTLAEQGSYRVRVHNHWFTDLGIEPASLTSTTIYADLLPYVPLARNLPDDASQYKVAALTPKLALAEDTANSGDVNFVRVFTPRMALTDPAHVQLGRPDSVNVSTTYLDGLGRPMQTVQHEASPQHRDLVQPHAYDALGRESYQFLPYAAVPTTQRQGYHAGALAQQDAFYRPTSAVGPPVPTDPTIGVPRTGASYAQTLFETSPLNRVVAQGAAGEAWQLTAGHFAGRAERPNTALDSVLQFHPGYDPSSLDPGYQGYYASGELWGVITADEQRHQTIEWKDKLGQVVCKQAEAARPDTMSTSLPSRWLRTSYVYDDFNHLRFVIQPEGTKRILTSPPPPSPLAQGLRLYLPFDQTSGAQALDVSGGNTPGQLVDGGQWVPSSGGPHAQALRLLGTAHLVVPLAWQPTAFTIAFWVKPSQVLNYSCLLSANPDNAGSDPWGNFAFHATSDGHISAGFNYWDATGRLASPAGAMQAGSWQHFAFTYQGGTGSLYCNGQLVSQLTGMPAAPAWPGLLLGQGASNVNDPFEGDVSELRVYERALPTTEVQQLFNPSSAAATPTPPVVTQLVAPYLFHYRYDGRGRQIAKQVPGQDGETLVVYDQLDRPILSQDPMQRTRHVWSVTKYDALGRLVLTGELLGADTLSQRGLQVLASADTAANHQFEVRVTSNEGYSYDHSFPRPGQQGFGYGQVLSAVYYDDYDFNNDGQPDARYDTSQDSQFPRGQAPVADVVRTQGLVTRTLTKVLGVADNDPTQAAWLTTTTFYDDRARPVQVQTMNALKGTDLLTTQLDFMGKVVQSVASHQVPSLATPLLVKEFFSYDHMGRLLTTRQQLPGEARPARLDSAQYNEVGQVVRKTLGTGRLTQQVDYAYNIRGWLTSLNDPYQPNPTKNDLFGLSLHYERGFTTGYEQYNGNLTGQTWRGRDGVQRAYGYVYDPLNRLLQGDFVARQTTTAATPSAGAWTAEQDNYRLSFVSYDDNGNILTLRRRGLLQNATHTQGKQYGAVDNLTYAYQGNRLTAVDDAVTGNQLPRPANYNGAPTSVAGDFQEQGVKLGQEYLYDANGNLTQDKNKGITGIVYNHLNLPRQIHFGQVGDSVVFRYSASGQKVAKLVYQTGKPVLRTNYLGPYQYEQDSLKFFPHAEGRVLRFVSYDAANTPRVSYQREFTFKDHLGNLRLAYRAGQVRTLTATLEQDANTRKRETQQFDSLSVSPPIAITAPLARSGAYAAKLNAGGTTPQPLGPLTQLGVQKGDTVSVTAYGYYPQAQQHGFFFSLASFVASLLHPTSPPPVGLDAGKRQGLPLLQVGLGAGLASLPQLSGGVPQGYLRLLVFDKDSVLLKDQCRVVQLTQDANRGYETLHVQAILPQDGYVTAYVGSQSNVDVFFDDVTIEHRQGLQIQENQYDPWGQSLIGINEASVNLKQVNSYQYSGKEQDNELGLHWTDYAARMYDAQIGKWASVDPLAEKFFHASPYNFVNNNPVNTYDPDGRSGIATRDDENQKITVTSRIYFYGAAGSEALAKRIGQDLQAMFNNAHGTATIDGKKYSVEFKIEGFYDPNIKNSDVVENKDPTNNYVLVQDERPSNLTASGEVLDEGHSSLGGNTGRFWTGDIGPGSTTPSHEMMHGYQGRNSYAGKALDVLGHPYDRDATNDSPPGMLYGRGSRALLEYNRPGPPWGFMNPDTRRVNQNDIDFMGLGSLKYNANGQATVGSMKGATWYVDPASQKQQPKK